MVIKLAQMCGLVESIMKGISSWFNGLLGNIVSGILYYFYAVTIGPLLFIIDIINALFRKFAGLGTYYDQAAHGVLSGDFVYSLITSRAVTNVFWAMIILAVILLIITTFIAVIKSEFTPIMDKSNNNNKRKIIGIAVKSLINFAVVPICAVIGVLIGNALLRTIDGATGGGEGSSMGGRIFVAGAYDANIIRKYVNNPELDDVRLVKCRDNIVNEFYGSGATWNTLSENQKNELADLVDDLFSQGITNITQSKYFYLSADMIGYYDLLSFNFFLCLICVVAIGYFMIMILIGLIKRIFAMVTLFVIAPPIIALSPINGKVLEGWNKLFIKNMLAAYSSVVAINLYLIVLRALQNVQFFAPNEFGLIGGEGFANQIAYMLIMIGGLVFTKDLTKDVAGLIGADSALSEGISASKEFAATTGKMVGLGATMLKPATAGAKLAGKVGGKAVGLGAQVAAKGAKVAGGAIGKFAYNNVYATAEGKERVFNRRRDKILEKAAKEEKKGNQSKADKLLDRALDLEEEGKIGNTIGDKATYKAASAGSAIAKFANDHFYATAKGKKRVYDRKRDIKLGKAAEEERNGNQDNADELFNEAIKYEQKSTKPDKLVSLGKGVVKGVAVAGKSVAKGAKWTANKAKDLKQDYYNSEIDKNKEKREEAIASGNTKIADKLKKKIEGLERARDTSTLDKAKAGVANHAASIGNAIIGSDMLEAFDKGRKGVAKGGFHDPYGEGKKKSDEARRKKENRELAKEIADAIKQADQEKNNSAKPAQKVKIEDESVRGLGKQIGKDISGELNNTIKGLATELEKTVEKLKKDDKK